MHALVSHHIATTISHGDKMKLRHSLLLLALFAAITATSTTATASTGPEDEMSEEEMGEIFAGEANKAITQINELKIRTLPNSGVYLSAPIEAYSSINAMKLSQLTQA